MSNTRTLPPVCEMMTHDQGMKDCFVATSTAIHTVEINGKHFASMVFNQAECPIGACVFLDRSEVEAQITLLKNAIDDAERMDQGLKPLHASPSLVRQ